MKIINIGKITISQNDIHITGFDFDVEGQQISRWTYKALYIKVVLWAIWKLLKGIFENPICQNNHFTDLNGNFVEAP